MSELILPVAAIVVAVASLVINHKTSRFLDALEQDRAEYEARVATGYDFLGESRKQHVAWVAEQEEGR